MMFLGIGIIRTEKCWPNSPTYSKDVGVLEAGVALRLQSTFWVARQKRLRNTALEDVTPTLVVGFLLAGSRPTRSGFQLGKGCIKGTAVNVPVPIVY